MTNERVKALWAEFERAHAAFTLAAKKLDETQLRIKAWGEEKALDAEWVAAEEVLAAAETAIIDEPADNLEIVQLKLRLAEHDYNPDIVWRVEEAVRRDIARLSKAA